MNKLIFTHMFEPFGYPHLVRQSFRLNADRFLIFTPKVAGSSIKRELLRAYGEEEFKGDIHAKLRHLNRGFGELGYRSFVNSLTQNNLEVFALVRDPIERIQSAFCDKFLDFFSTKSVKARASIRRQARLMFNLSTFERWEQCSCDQNFSDGDIHSFFNQFVSFILRTHCIRLDPHFASQFINIRYDLFPSINVYKIESFSNFCHDIQVFPLVRENISKRYELDVNNFVSNETLHRLRARYSLDYFLYERAL